ncbi:MAG: SRPBCC domain-containing protein [Longimicrobiales bacterium]
MADPQKLVSRVLIKGRIEDVWHEITKTDRPQLAMFGAQMHRIGLQPGSPIRMRSADGKYTSVVGEILEVDPPFRLSHTMKFTAYDDPYCRVTYDLKEVDGGVEFTLTSEDMPAGTKTAKSMSRGGDFITKTLKAVVEQGRPSLTTRLLYVVFNLIGPLMTPKRCRTEHWPLEEG